MSDPGVRRIVVDVRGNRLILELDGALPVVGVSMATIDIGAFGRLIGVEIAGAYLAIADQVPGSELHGRSASTSLTVEDGGHTVMIPRTGDSWDISFPSGNQCWNRAGGAGSICSVLAGT